MRSEGRVVLQMRTRQQSALRTDSAGCPDGNRRSLYQAMFQRNRRTDQVVTAEIVGAGQQNTAGADADCVSDRDPMLPKQQDTHRDMAVPTDADASCEHHICVNLRVVPDLHIAGVNPCESRDLYILADFPANGTESLQLLWKKEQTNIGGFAHDCSSRVVRITSSIPRKRLHSCQSAIRVSRSRGMLAPGLNRDSR